MDGIVSLSGKSSFHPTFDHEGYHYADRVANLIKGTVELWAAGSTFRNACDISVLYVTGLLPTSPYHAGPIWAESTGIAPQLTRCTRNGLLTISSEPYGSDINVITGRQFTVENASIQFYVKNHNNQTLLYGLEEYGDRFDIQNPKTKFSDEFGPSYSIEDDDVTGYFITDTDELSIWHPGGDFQNLYRLPAPGSRGGYNQPSWKEGFNLSHWDGCG